MLKEPIVIIDDFATRSTLRDRLIKESETYVELFRRYLSGDLTIVSNLIEWMNMESSRYGNLTIKRVIRDTCQTLHPMSTLDFYVTVQQLRFLLTNTRILPIEIPGILIDSMRVFVPTNIRLIDPNHLPRQLDPTMFYITTHTTKPYAVHHLYPAHNHYRRQ